MFEKSFAANPIFKIYFWPPERNSNEDCSTLWISIDIPLLPLLVTEASTCWLKENAQNGNSTGSKQPRNLKRYVIYITPKNYVNVCL